MEPKATPEPENATKPRRKPTPKIRTAAQIEAAKPRFFSRRDLVERWGVSVSTLKRWEAAGKIDPIRVTTRLTKYRIEEIDAVELELFS